VGEAPREPALRRGRRAAQPAGDLRLARGEHLPAAAGLASSTARGRSSSARRRRSATRRSSPRRSPSGR
jgi:hypothetical protein